MMFQALARLGRRRRALALTAGALAVLGSFGACGTSSSQSEYPDGGAPAVDAPVTPVEGGPCVGLACASTDGAPGCVGLQCQQVACAGGAKTTVSGTVYDPAGRVPIYNAFVYVPNSEPAAIQDGASCDRCDGQLTGRPLVVAATDAAGRFRLENVPVGSSIPLVIQVGKWRRQVKIPAVAACVDTEVDAGLTRLPRNRGEGHIPKMALSTGAADPLECLLRKIGLDDSEFGVEGSPARVHLFAGGGYTSDGTPFAATRSFANGADFTPSTGLWKDAASLRRYDVVLLSCEGDENDASKPDAARVALDEYSRSGGRVFASHYHNTFFSASPSPEVRSVATWTDTRPDPAGRTETIQGTVETAFPKGAAMKEWLKNTGSLAPEGTLPIQETRHNVERLGPGALGWIRVSNPKAGGAEAVQYFSYNAPLGVPDAEVCGRVVFSNLHVGAGNSPGSPFPGGCTADPLTPQQKALTFMLFDLSSCVQRDDQAPQVPR